MDGPHDVIELLIHDHRVISDLAQQLDETDQPVVLRELYVRLVQELAAHEAAEPVSYTHLTLPTILRV